ncbi:hypothetical protein [Methylomonas albis]|uniref:Uncharacterized protein n=1 Tax=Methylomonas albis TaxID=1854563 RepID=A0ABR9D6R3_9GAMM|nr:hypothetical protein [Methylomonas albis]MBD9358755.1 hypothetical protein [Methylomonas albis]
MSSVSGVGSSPYVAQTYQAKMSAPPPQPAATPVQPVAKDADGDNDGSVGKNIDVRA